MQFQISGGFAPSAFIFLHVSSSLLEDGPNLWSVFGVCVSALGLLLIAAATMTIAMKIYRRESTPKTELTSLEDEEDPLL